MPLLQGTMSDSASHRDAPHNHARTMRGEIAPRLQSTRFSATLRLVAMESTATNPRWRILSAVMCALALWAASLQLNDPDPERWFTLYAACGFVALLNALSRASAPLSLAVGASALVWACAIVPELFGRWTPADLGASMSAARPEVEYGREFGGLSIVASYCAVSWLLVRRHESGKAPSPEPV